MFGPKIRFEYDRGEKSGGRVEVELCPPRDEAEAARFYAGWISDNRIRMYLSMEFPITESAELDWIRKQNEKPDDIVWSIYVGKTLVGNIGVHRINRGHKHGELGIMIGEKNLWGKGLAQAIEAVVLDYAFQNIVAGGLNKLSACVLSGNEASKRALLKVGFCEVGEKRDHFWFQGKWFNLWESEILASEWRKMRSHVTEKVGMKVLDLYCGCEDVGHKPERFD